MRTVKESLVPQEAEPFSVPEHCPYCDTQVVEADTKSRFVNGIQPAEQGATGCEFCNPAVRLVTH